MSEPGDSSRPLRPLLPATLGRFIEPAPSGTGQPARPRTTITAACNSCRRRKAKCSGERPACTLCVKRKLDCQYETDQTETHAQARKRKYDEARNETSLYVDLVRLLKTRPQPEANDILRRIRAGVDVQSILSHVEAGDLLVQLAVTPEARMRYEFPYMSGMPPSLLPGNPYLESLIYESATLFSRPAELKVVVGSDATVLRDKFGLADYQSPYLKPVHAAEVVEPRLSSVRPSRWTSVCADDALMRELLATFLRCEYLFNAPFQKDYFLDDMASGCTAFCSPLLVNAVLAYCCACHTAFHDRSEYWNPETLSYRFMAETKRLWELEADKPRITTIQAAIVLDTVHSMCGLDKIGRAYSIHAMSLAQRMRLMEPPSDRRSKRDRAGWAYTAWMLFAVDALIAFHFMHPPRLDKRPTMPLPDPFKDPDWYGEIWIKYPLAQTLSRVLFAHMFRARCQMRMIMADIARAYFQDGAVVTPPLTGAFARRLESWHEQLPECLLPRWIVHPSHFQAHIEYHNVMMTLHQPLAQRTDLVPTPLSIVLNSTKNIQTLLRVYYLRHGFEALHSFLCQPLALIAFMCLDSIKQERSTAELEILRSTLFLVAKGFRDQGRSHYLGQTLFQVIKGQMQPEEAALMKGIASIPDDDDEAGTTRRMQAVHSQWPASLVLGSGDVGDIEASRLSALVEQISASDIDEGSGRSSP